MKLSVHVIEARNLPAMDLNGFSDPYARIQLGKYRFRTKVVKKCLNPFWDEEFSFRVEDLNEELTVSVLDEDKYFNDDFVGQLKVPVWRVFDAENKTLGTVWYPLQPKNKKSKNRDCGEICLTISLSQNNSFVDQLPVASRSVNDDHAPEKPTTPPRELSVSTNGTVEEAIPAKDDKSYAQTLAERLVQIFLNKNGETASTTNEVAVSSDLQETLPKTEVQDNKVEDMSSYNTFEETLRSIELRDQGAELPSNLPGGVLLDQQYVISPADLNSLIFSPGSKFMKSLAELQGTTDLQEGPWMIENGADSLKRVVSYTKAATKLVKAVKATEEQVYVKADGKFFAVLLSASTPDVPYGSCFKVELLFCIMPGTELPSGDQSSRLVISWRMNFLQSTIMKGMIESGARQGLKDSYEQFAKLLAQNVKLVDSKDLGSDKEQILASLQTEQQSDWKLAVRYFGNFTVVSAVFMGLYVFTHIMLAMPSTIQGLEFKGLDLPDSIGEVVVCGVLVLQGERVLEKIARFMQARMQRGSDHGVKAQGDGWLLTVALIEGTNLAAVDSTGFSDPYVILTCNGKTRTSSIKFQTLDPQWNEIFEFDAMDEPPSMMDVEVFDFDGPFDEATSLGHTEINFVKSNLSELADIWIPLQGKLAQACQSKLHLRIFLNNTRGTDIVKEYITKMEKEVGKKINLRSPQTNSAFQKLFGLPPEEFLINDFTCHLKRKMPLQGRLFLSARIIGFHANLFGHKTKFFFLWEDIEDIQVVPPSLASVGSPSLIIILRRGRGMDAKHGAKAQDEEGRLKFHFQSFVSFHIANRTIMALWKARALSPEQKVQIVEEESDAKFLQTEESGSFLGIEDASMSEVYSSVLPIPANSLIELFNGGYLDRKVMEKVGCLDYSSTPWEFVKNDVYQRQLCYKFDKHVSRYGGQVTSTQQKSPIPDRNGWVVEEVMTLQGVPLGDNFSLHIRYQVEGLPSRSKACNVQVFMGIAWLKSTKHQKRITKNVISNLADRLKEMFSLVEKEFTPGK
ncbi:C2 and GRAM domain-containing protein At1g03370 [Magnolia sinica]|uniref:C2 and GRAM domain-containing protein At1g03370 n=1 Tax=Magnolia sinica TaxID=86752 RepID=UPI00265B4A0C|nr:C2 and GRAM domain-containing protein At1g03370 [Magnolia sinica]